MVCKTCRLEQLPPFHIASQLNSCHYPAAAKGEMCVEHAASRLVDLVEEASPFMHSHDAYSLDSRQLNLR